MYNCTVGSFANRNTENEKMFQADLNKNKLKYLDFHAGNKNILFATKNKVKNI